MRKPAEVQDAFRLLEELRDPTVYHSSVEAEGSSYLELAIVAGGGWVARSTLGNLTCESRRSLLEQGLWDWRVQVVFRFCLRDVLA